MTHTIRQRVINELGQKVTKIYKVEGELGSGILDKNGNEIFENDILALACEQRYGKLPRYKVVFQRGEFLPLLEKDWGREEVEIYEVPSFWNPPWLVVVGHADDQN